MSELLSKRQKARVLADVLFFGALFLLPWWILLPTLFAGLFLFSYFIEFVVFILLLDLLYSIPEYSTAGTHFPLLLLALAVFIVAEPLKERLILDTR